MTRTRLAAHVAALILLACMRADLVGLSAQTTGAVDREYVLEATMLGYRGIGGEIDGVRNPTLWARPGETVRITIINGEVMVHDVVLEQLGIKSPQILDKGATTSITFKASDSDTYYCSVPGHRQAGMAGRLEVSDEPRPTSEGAAPAANGRALNLDFENGTLNDWTAAGDAFELVKAESQTGTRNGHAGTYWVSSAVGGSARKGSLTSVPFTVTHPYASFLVSGGAFDSTRV
ncbi:MAG: cupredoxin domain-containing protein, partial [Vicinamibacterales bacterium]